MAASMVVEKVECLVILSVEKWVGGLAVSMDDITAVW